MGAPLDQGLQSADPLRFPGYRPPKAEEESVRTWSINVAGIDAIWIDGQSQRCGGTVGVVAGEQVVRAYDTATALRRPVVATMSGGGVRVEEGVLALAQSARVAAAMARHRAARLITVAHFGSPMAGGAYASWISLADVRAAEPGARMGVEGSTSSAERAYADGLIDAVVPLERRWHWVAEVLGGRREQALELPAGRPGAPDTSAVPADPYGQLLRCRAADRPSGLEWAAWVTDGWVELRGGTNAVRAGLAWIGEHRVIVIAMDRHAEPGSHGLPAADGLLLAQRAIRLADRWQLPLLTIVDAPSVPWASGSDGEAMALQAAQTLLALSEVRSTTVSLVVGEAGSTGAGGALTHADRLLMLDGALFSTVESEQHDAEVMAAYGMRARNLVDLGVADRVLEGGVSAVREALAEAIAGSPYQGRVDRLDRATERALINSSVRRPCGRGGPTASASKSSSVVDGIEDS